MERYKVESSIIDITESTILTPQGYGAWYAENIGTADALIDGYTVTPGSKFDAWAGLQPNVSWDSPIRISITSGAHIRLTRLIYTII